MKIRGVAANSALALIGDLAAKAGIRSRDDGRRARAQYRAVRAARAAARDGDDPDLGARSRQPDAADARRRAVAPSARRSAARAGDRPNTADRAALAHALVVGAVTGRPEALATLLLAAAGTAQLSHHWCAPLGSGSPSRRLSPSCASRAQLTVAAGRRAPASFPATVLSSSLPTTVTSPRPDARCWARRVIARGPRPAPRPLLALRRAAPLGAMALATLAYYRSGTIALSLCRRPRQTADSPPQARSALGLLCVGNAATTGLLPRLAAATDDADRDRGDPPYARLGQRRLCAARRARRARCRTAAECPVRCPAMWAARGALALLAAATALIAPAGVLGTALIAIGRVRPVAVQVGAFPRSSTSSRWPRSFPASVPRELRSPRLPARRSRLRCSPVPRRAPSRACSRSRA